MVLRKIFVCSFAVLLSLQPLAADDGILYNYSGNHGFAHETGQHSAFGWQAQYRVHAPGYFVRGRPNGGEMLPAGTYCYLFHLRRQGKHAGGLLKQADDVVRVEAWDVTADERLMTRTFQIADFPQARKTAVQTLTFSTWGRANHHFEPRVFWPGLSGAALERIELKRLQDTSWKSLERKADIFESSMPCYFDRGFVVARTHRGTAEDVDDTGIWTGLYAASQAWRYQATRSPEALQRMEAALWALHSLHARSPVRGTLIRYWEPNGTVHSQIASKDLYLGFIFASAQCLPQIKSKVLHQALADDLQALGNHFLDHDLAFSPGQADSALDLNPYPSGAALDELVEELRSRPELRKKLIRGLRATQVYLLLHGQRPWPEASGLVRTLNRHDAEAIRRQILPVLNGALRVLRHVQRNTHRSAQRRLGEASPYGKLSRLLLDVLQRLSPMSQGKGFEGIHEIKILPSQSLHALHILKVLGETLPKPNRFETFYQNNLWQNKALLKTALDWYGLDEDFMEAVVGRARAGAMRSGNNTLSYLALYDLMEQEKDPSVQALYRVLFERQYRSQQDEYNALLHVLQPQIGLSPEQAGLGLWSLTLYPMDRWGRGEAYWRDHRAALAARYGGEVSGQARDPLPLNERPRDVFIWQRSARSLRGDNSELQYPPLDYLFVYWLAKSNKY